MSERVVSIASDGELHGKYKGEFIPRWIKQNIKKEKPCNCCVSGCGKTSNVVVCSLILIV